MHSFRPVRAIYCPICAFECRQQMRHEVVYPNCLFSPQLQGALRAAVYGVGVLPVSEDTKSPLV